MELTTFVIFYFRYFEMNIDSKTILNVKGAKINGQKSEKSTTI